MCSEIELPAHLLTPAWSATRLDARRSWSADVDRGTRAGQVRALGDDRPDHRHDPRELAGTVVVGRIQHRPGSDAENHTKLAMRIAGVTGNERRESRQPRAEKNSEGEDSVVRVDDRRARKRIPRSFWLSSRAPRQTTGTRRGKYGNTSTPAVGFSTTRASLPWMLWPAGELPPHWWMDRRFVEAVTA